MDDEPDADGRPTGVGETWGELFEAVSGGAGLLAAVGQDDDGVAGVGVVVVAQGLDGIVSGGVQGGPRVLVPVV